MPVDQKPSLPKQDDTLSQDAASFHGDENSRSSFPTPYLDKTTKSKTCSPSSGTTHGRTMPPTSSKGKAHSLPCKARECATQQQMRRASGRGKSTPRTRAWKLQHCASGDTTRGTLNKRDGSRETESPRFMSGAAKFSDDGNNDKSPVHSAAESVLKAISNISAGLQDLSAGVKTLLGAGGDLSEQLNLVQQRLAKIEQQLMEPKEQLHAQSQEFKLGPSPEAKLGTIFEELEENLEVAEELEEDQDLDEIVQQKQHNAKVLQQGKDQEGRQISSDEKPARLVTKPEVQTEVGTPPEAKPVEVNAKTDAVEVKPISVEAKPVVVAVNKGERTEVAPCTQPVMVGIHEVDKKEPKVSSPHWQVGIAPVVEVKPVDAKLDVDEDKPKADSSQVGEQPARTMTPAAAAAMQYAWRFEAEAKQVVDVKPDKPDTVVEVKPDVEVKPAVASQLSQDRHDASDYGGAQPTPIIPLATVTSPTAAEMQISRDEDHTMIPDMDKGVRPIATAAFEHGGTTVAPTTTPVPVGERLLKKHGWKQGEGLGAKTQGLGTAPDSSDFGQTRAPCDRAGLGYKSRHETRRGKYTGTRPADFGNHFVRGGYAPSGVVPSSGDTHSSWQAQSANIDLQVLEDFRLLKEDFPLLDEVAHSILPWRVYNRMAPKIKQFGTWILDDVLRDRMPADDYLRLMVKIAKSRPTPPVKPRPETKWRCVICMTMHTDMTLDRCIACASRKGARW